MPGHSFLAPDANAQAYQYALPLHSGLRPTPNAGSVIRLDHNGPPSERSVALTALAFAQVPDEVYVAAHHEKFAPETVRFPAVQQLEGGSLAGGGDEGFAMNVSQRQVSGSDRDTSRILKEEFPLLVLLHFS